MLSILRAHGLDPGYTQRPLSAGTLAGLAAAAPALVVLVVFGWIDALATALPGGLRALAVLACAATMAGGGFLYGLVFRRAANDPVGGWLFGVAFGFLLWMVVPVALLQWLPARPSFVGRPAMGLLVGALVWGAALGGAFPFIHRRMRAGLDRAGATEAAPIGPEAAAVPATFATSRPTEAGK